MSQTIYYETTPGSYIITNAALVNVYILRVCREGVGYNKHKDDVTRTPLNREYTYDILGGRIIFQTIFSASERVMVRFKTL